MPGAEPLDLFDDAANAGRAELEDLARAIPPLIHFGTSTWTYPGWQGDVYHRTYRGAQPARRLTEYARYPLFSTVGIDSSFYAPPAEEVLTAYASALPAGFRCVLKVWDRITIRRFRRDERWGAEAGRLNPDFLNPGLFIREVLHPTLRAFGGHLGAFVFEFQRMHGADLFSREEWAAQLDGFFAALPDDVPYAVELRTPSHFSEEHGAVLRHHGVAHVFNSWTDSPPIGTQLDFPWAFPAPFAVARALLRPGRRYEDAVRRFQPYERVQEAQPAVRNDLLALMAQAMRRRIEVFIVVNNRLEGNAPGTIRAVVERWRNEHHAA